MSTKLNFEIIPNGGFDSNKKIAGKNENGIVYAYITIETLKPEITNKITSALEYFLNKTMVTDSPEAYIEHLVRTEKLYNETVKDINTLKNRIKQLEELTNEGNY